jgi:predicted nicotinamide N-methyase
MRFLIACVAMLTVLMLGSAAAPVAMAATHSGYALVAADQQQPAQGKLDVNIDVNKGGGGGDWWANPVWIAIGAIGLVLLVVIVAMVARGGGTTVIKE